jgi:TonB family protein
MKTKFLFLIPLLFLSGCSLIWSPTATAKKFMASAEKGDVDTMTSLFSSKAKRNLGLEKIRLDNQNFADMVRTAIKGGAKLKVAEVNEIVDHDNARVLLVYQDSDKSNSIDLDFALSRDNGAWKIEMAHYDSGQLGGPSPSGSPSEGISLPPTPPSASSSDVPLPPAPSPGVRGPISGGVLNGKATSLPQPPYPPIARAAKASGTVMVQVLVDENGNVVSAHAISGHPLLQAACVAAARNAKFSPTKLSGQPVKVSGIVTYDFAPQ